MSITLLNTSTNDRFTFSLNQPGLPLPVGSYKVLACTVARSAYQLEGNFTVLQTNDEGQRFVTTASTIPLTQIVPFNIVDPNFVIIAGVAPYGKVVKTSLTAL